MQASEKPTEQNVVDWAETLYSQGVDKKDAEVFANAFTENGWCRFGNNEPLVGREAIRGGIAQFFKVMAGLSHESSGTWYKDGNLILEARVTYTLHKGGTVTVPAVSIYKMTAGESGRPMAENCRIYVDLAPLFAAAQEGAA